MKTKVCSRCAKRKRVTSFYGDKTKKSGLSYYCKKCHNEASRKNGKKWYASNKERKLEVGKLWEANNKEKRKAIKKRWRENADNKEREKEYRRKFYRDNRDRLLRGSREWSKANPENNRKRTHKKRAIKKGALGWMPPYPEGILFGQQVGLCLYCSADLEQSGWHMEHKIPLSRGGRHDWNNVCLSCPGCNQTKHTKTAEEFMA